MNAAPIRNRFFLERFRGHLPEVLYTNVPYTEFLDTPLSIPAFLRKPPGLFNPSKIKKPTPTKVETKKKAENTIEGIITVGINTRFSLDAKDLEIDGGTWIIGDLDYGMRARAKGKMLGDRFKVAQIVILKQSRN